MPKMCGIVLIAFLAVLSGCGKKNTGDEPAPASETQQQLAQHQPKSSDFEISEEAHKKNSLPAETESPQPKRSAGSKATLESEKEYTASRPALSKGATANDVVPAQAPQAAEEKAIAPIGPIILKGAPLGGVRFEHGKHVAACESCHHPPREPKSANASRETCTSCHTKPPRPGMKTGKQAAFHNPPGTAGTCIDCHKKAAGTPTKCMQCHRKENT